MKKDSIHDYAVEAFRFYHQVGGLSGYEGIIVSKAKERQAKGGFLLALKEVEAEHAAELLDVMAVEKTLESFARAGRKDILYAIETVYCTDSGRPMRKGAVQDRVRYVETTLPAAERSVYRCLKKARDQFADIRGLRQA